MLITVSNEINDELMGPFEFGNNAILLDLMILIGFDASKQVLWYNMKPINSQDKLKHLYQFGIGNNDLIIIKAKKIPETSNLKSLPFSSEYIEAFRNRLLTYPTLKDSIGIPGLEKIIQNKEHFERFLKSILFQNSFSTSHHEQLIQMTNPNDPMSQKRILEMINQYIIDEQMTHALEYTPEVFAPVHMLYINLHINDTPVKALVDSGAQTTIMSANLAEKAGLTKFIDKRFGGYAKGIGTSKILGKIHMTQIKIETQFIPCSFTVLDTTLGMLLGLDMLKRHQACINLNVNTLEIAGVNTPFLPESEIPNEVEENGSITKLKSSLNSGIETTIENENLKKDISKSIKNKYSETGIKKLMALGFSYEEVVTALECANGNFDLAGSLLFQ